MVISGTSSAALFRPVLSAKGSSACSSCSDAEGPTKGASGSSSTGKPLTEEQKQQVEKLKARDAEVRRHEAAHLAVAGGNARGGAVFNYQTGPDGKSYAVGGHVDIDVSTVPGNPRATLAKMQQVQHAALAPADPSGQDRTVAAQAAAAEQKARTELAKQGTQQGGKAGSGQHGTAAKRAGSPSTSPYAAASASATGELIDVSA